MNEKHKQILLSQKFERISFAIDYLRQMQVLQNGELKVEDFTQALSKFYDTAFNDGSINALEVYVASMFNDLDDLYGKDS